MFKLTIEKYHMKLEAMLTASQSVSLSILEHHQYFPAPVTITGILKIEQIFLVKFKSNPFFVPS